MKNITTWILYIIGITITVLYFTIFYNNEYMKFKIRRCVVLDKLPSEGGYKHSENFYMVLREERGIVFDMIVSPATYSQHKRDEVVYFNLRESDINQTPRDNAIYFFGSIIMMICTVLFFVLAVIHWVDLIKQRFKKSKIE